MKKKLVIELIIYVVIVIVSIVMMIIYQPRELEIVLPKDFQIEQEGGVGDVVIPIQQRKY
ncbi:hypothetical protein [Fusibacter ferrireducens]|uniref:Uncharacterized protein n=1 Tax=Fusibacter ferrireducens TaxID=2785058 RepID=A0ABR9ZPM4_9FIRM|nr:hypothetical protein [Fusibacter ferrireducens]MBF4692271.1 hypothetical protein [Fusibacter ferrireducens]